MGGKLLNAESAEKPRGERREKLLTAKFAKNIRKEREEKSHLQREVSKTLERTSREGAT